MSVLKKASELIDCLGQAGEPVSLAFVRSALDMPKSSTHRLLGELAGLGIVRRTEDGRYSLGPRLLYWGEAAAETFDLRVVAEPVDAAPAGRGRRERAPVHPGRATRAPASPPSRPATSCARSSSWVGRCRCGRAPPASCCWRSRTRRPSGSSCGGRRRDAASIPTRPAPDSRSSSSGSGRSAGPSSVGERENGVAAAATPIVDTRGRVVAALCISGPTTRLVPRAPRRRCAGRWRRCAAEISALLRARLTLNRAGLESTGRAVELAEQLLLARPVLGDRAADPGHVQVVLEVDVLGRDVAAPRAAARGSTSSASRC